MKYSKDHAAPHITTVASNLRRKILASKGCSQCYVVVGRGSVTAVALYGQQRVSAEAGTEGEALSKLASMLNKERR